MVSVDEGAVQATLEVRMDIKGNTLSPLEDPRFRVIIVELTLRCMDTTTGE